MKRFSVVFLCITALAVFAAVERSRARAGKFILFDFSLWGYRGFRFGNLVTNVDRRSFERFAEGRPLQVTAGSHPVGKVVATYADAEAGSVCALFGSTDHLEVAVSGGSAAEQLGLGRGAPVSIVRS